MDRRRAAGALLALAACFATATAAPTSNHTTLDLYDGPTEGCYYNFQHYGEGDRIMTNEPCLNCTCHNRMLMCYLRVCPFTKPIGQDCTVEKRADQCCPIVTCPDVPVDLLTSTSTTSPAEYGGTGVGRVDKYGCSINGKYFPEGAKVPSTPNKPCEHCYCIRNMTTCVMQECTLHVDGCTPIYHKDVCCPVRYFCDHPEDEPLQLDDMTTTTRPTPGFLLTTTTTEEPTTEIQTKRECIEDGQIYADGALIKTEKPCVHCYCMKGDIVCVVQECGTPMENEGKNCTSIPPREGQCCPDTYICEGDETTTGTPLEEIATTKYRSETDKTYTEPSLEKEGSGDEVPLTTVPSDLSTPKVEQRLEEKGEGEGPFSPFTTESLIFDETEQATTEPDKGLNTVPSDNVDKEYTKPTETEQTTIREDILSTTHFVSHDQDISTVSSVHEPDSEIPETTSSESKMEEPTTVLSVQIEDETTQATLDKTTPKDIEEVTESIIESKLETAATTDSDHSRTTQSNIISEFTTEPVLPKETTLKSETVTETKQTTLEPDNLASMGTDVPKDVHTEATVTDFTEYSSEAPKEKTTTVHDREVTEPSKPSEESEISTQLPQEDITERLAEVTEPTLIEEEPTTHIEITPAASSEPPMFDENTTKHDVKESEQHQTTIYSIEDGLITRKTTPKEAEDVKEPTEPTTPKEDKAPTTESLVKETEATQQPPREETLAPAIESEQKPTTEPTLELHVEEEGVSSVTPSTERVPQDEKQETTEVNVITTLQPVETTTLNPEDNEISEDILPPGRIPGEGDCLLNGVTYRNDSSVPNTNKCQSSCKCISSIIKCDPIICSPQPEYMENCQLVYDTPDSCCPTYICEETKETIPPQSHSQMSGTESPSPSPSLQCNGDECELSVEKQPTTVLPDLTKTPTSDSCGPEGCESQLPEQQPEKCVGDKCTECNDGSCPLPSSPEIPPHSPTETITQRCEGSEGCLETKTEIPACEGESCVSETLPPTAEIPTPCEGDSCPVQPEGCTSDKCVPSDNIPPQTTQQSEICTDESGCIKLQEKGCEGDNCRRHEKLPSKCTGLDCAQREQISPEDDSRTPLATTEKTLLEFSTLLPESHSTLHGESATEPHIITENISDSTTSIPGDHKITDVSFDTKAPEGTITTPSPPVTEGFEAENTVPDEKITETETLYTEQPSITSTSVYTNKEITTIAKESEIVSTESPAVTESQEALTLSPVESATQREDSPTEAPESTLSELDTEKETDKPQTPLSEFESTQPEFYEPTTKASVSEQPEKSTKFVTHDEGTEIPELHVPSTSISSTQEISGLKTTPEYLEQSTTSPESSEKVGEQENITRSPEGAEQSTKLPEISIEQETTPLSSDYVTTPAEKIEHATTIPCDIEKETSQQTTIEPQDVTSILPEESIKTDLPPDMVTHALKPVDEKTVTETTLSPVTILYDTESPLELVPEDKLPSESPEIITKETESPAVEEQTNQIDIYPTTSRTVIAETTKKPEDEISPELPIEEMKTEMPISEGSLASDTKPTIEPSETPRPEIPAETPVSDITESTEPISISQDQESTPEIEIVTEGTGLTEKPAETETEMSIPVAITEEPSGGTKVTEDSQPCDNESECKKAQVPETFVTPATCLGESCIVQEEDCKSGECTQSSVPPKTSQTDICDEENGCIKTSEVSPECTEENCRKTDTFDLDQGKIPISDTEKTTESPSILEEGLPTKTPVETHATETVVPVSYSAEQAATQSTPSLETEMPQTTISYLPEKTITETVAGGAEKEVTEIPESLITGAPIPSETQKYDVSSQTDATQPSEVTPQKELTTKQPEVLDTELPSSHDVIPEKEVTMAPEEQLPVEKQEKTTKTPVSVEVTVQSTEETESMVSVDEHITEIPELNKPEEYEFTTQPETIDMQTISPDQHQPEVPQPEVTTEHSEVTPNPEQDHDIKEAESETEGPGTPYTIQDLSTKEPELHISQESETTKVPAEETTVIPHITEQSTEPKQEFSETTPYVVELEEHTHKIEKDITTVPLLEEPITQEPVYIHDVEKEHDIEMSTRKPSDVPELVPQYTDKPSVDNVSVETITPESYTTVSEEIPEITTESSVTEGIPLETSKPTSSDTTQELLSKFGTDATNQEKEISTVSPTLPEERQTTTIPSETEKPHSPADEIVPQTEQYTTYSPAVPFETTASEEFMPATSKTTTTQTDKDIATQSPSVFDKFTKPETSTDVYTNPAETQKPVFSEMPPTDEVLQPEDDGHIPPTGGYQPEPDYAEEDQAFGPGTCRYGGKVYVSAQQIPRDDPCDFCFCFRSDIICLQQSCPPPIHGCHEEPIQGFCCPRYECPVSMATTLNVTTTTTTTTTTLPPHFLPHAYKGAAQRKGCQIKGHIYKVGEVVRASSGPCLHCTCGGDGQMKCDPKVCTPEPMLRQMIAAAVSTKRRR